MSSNIFFASDTHFGHRKIVEGFGSENSGTHSEEGAGRPFATIEKHDEILVQNWNSVVRPQDTVWHLGDVLLGNTNFEILSRLNGHIKLILGNHDTWAKIQEYMKYFKRIEAYTTMGKDILVSHIPVHSCELKTRFKANIHGHRHHDPEPGNADPRYFNVSMEAINYTPIAYEEIRKQLKERGCL